MIAQPKDQWVSLHDVARMLGVILTHQQAWAIGKKLEKDYRMATKAAPVKGLRVKKSGAGSHCFALYSSEWIPLMTRRIRAYMAELAAQAELDL